MGATLLRLSHCAFPSVHRLGLDRARSVNTGAGQIKPSGTAIQRDGSAPDFRVFHVGASGNLTLNDLTVIGGIESDDFPANRGGAIASCCRSARFSTASSARPRNNARINSPIEWNTLLSPSKSQGLSTPKAYSELGERQIISPLSTSSME